MLSGGERQRLALARVFFNDAKIVGDGQFKELLENNQYFKELWNTALKNI